MFLRNILTGIVIEIFSCMCMSVFVGWKDTESFPVLSAVVLSFQTGLRRDLGVGSRGGKARPNVISCHPDSTTE